MANAVTLPRHAPLVLADLLPGAAVRDALLVLSGAGLIGLLAQVSIHLSFTPVPVTGQTLGVLLVGTALGWHRGLAAMLLYAAAGLFGVPWFAGARQRLRRCILRLYRRVHRLRAPVRRLGRARRRPLAAQLGSGHGDR